MKFDESYYTSRNMLKDDGHLHQIAVRIKQLFPGVVLDAGCGVGWVVKHLEEEGLQATGIDISQFGWEKRVSENVACSHFRDTSGEYDTILANKFLQCLSNKEVEEFATWSFKHCRKYIVILNSPGEGEHEYTRTTAHYQKVFTDAGWFVDESSYQKLYAITGWDCLVLAREPFWLSKKPALSPQQMVTSLIVDCWSGDEYLEHFSRHLQTLILFRTELVLLNTSRCKSIEDYLRADEKEDNKTGYKFRGTDIPVKLVNGEYRTVGETYQKGIRTASGSVAVLMGSGDQLSRTFIVAGIQELLGRADCSFVVPKAFFTYTEYRPFWLVGLQGVTFGGDDFPVSIPYGGFKYYRGAPIQLSDLNDTDCIPPIFIARTEDLQDRYADTDQLVFGGQDIIFDLVYNGKLGGIMAEEHSVTFLDEKRYTEEEVEEAKQRLLNRQR